MYIFFIGGTILAIIGIITFFEGRSNLEKSIRDIEQIYRDKIYEDLKDIKIQLQNEKLNFEKTRIELEGRRKVEQQRAAEAYEATQQVLAAEQNRLAAERQKIIELGEIEVQQKYEKLEQALQLDYQRKNNDLEEDFIKKKANYESQLENIEQDLDKFRSMQQSVNDAILRQKELEEKEDFYSIQISENDQEDIKNLQSMDLKLHNRDVIPKLIWELFIRRPCQEMIKRVTGGKKIGGIYKITNKQTGEAYIGKTSDFSTRWQNHCKTAIGLEGAARATLHNRLAQDGLWNYTFEILEEVNKQDLSQREAFYIDLYGTKKQLNMKNGDKNETK